MSGSSLDGLDLCAVAFDGPADQPRWEILAGVTLPYPADWVAILQGSASLTGEGLLSLHRSFGQFLATQIQTFLQANNLQPDLLSIHGHTVFHRPDEGWSFQLGQPEALARVLSIPVVSDFRNKDMAWGGQGAPLVPRGDVALFPQFSGWINLGGICNATIASAQGIVASDLGPFNQVLNYLSQKLGRPYDAGGALTAQGSLLETALAHMLEWPFFKQGMPKSLSNQQVAEWWFPLVDSMEPKDALRTFAEVMVRVVAQELDALPTNAQVLLSGGGAYHTFWVNRLRAVSSVEILLPEPRIIEWKEALIFAYLGWLRHQGLPNALPAATGAEKSTSGGTIIWPE
jgi:anhydro-N-acetylmuramic acid kinase